MHKELRELLDGASGESQFVIAANIDIRGFSSFFSDSSQAAAFLSSAYTRILESYFADLSFFKPTGDGLLLVRAVSRDNLQEVVESYVSDALLLDADFGEICADDDLINFETPRHVGIGLARGTATKISGGGKVLDFSGYPLNLASRLMDLARPHGVVFDASMGAHLLNEETFSQFSPDAVYVKGLADLTPLTVHATSDVAVPDSNRRPFGAEIFADEVKSFPFSQFKKLGPSFLHPILHTPSTRDSVKLHVSWPSTDEAGSRVQGVLTTRSVSPKSFVDRPEGLFAEFDYLGVVKAMTERGVKGTWEVDVQLTYSVPLRSVAKQSQGEAPIAAPDVDDDTEGS